MKGIRQDLYIIIVDVAAIFLSLSSIAYGLLCGFSLAALTLFVGGAALAVWLNSLIFKKSESVLAFL